MNKEKGILFLRIGLSITLFYAGIASFLNSQNWIGFIPEIFRIFSDTTMINLHVIFTITLGLWLLSGKKLFLSSLIYSVFIFVIIIFNFGGMDLIFRDIGLLFAGISLVLLNRK